MKKILYTLFILLIVITNSCKKDENTIEDEPTSESGTKISVIGIIENEYGQPVYGATVSVGDKQFNSDGNGLFFIDNVSVPTNRVVVTVTKTGYWDKQYAFIPSNGKQHYCKITIPIKLFNYTVSGTSGGTVNVGTSSILFQSNSFVKQDGTPYNGTVQIAAKHLAVSDPKLKALTPGRDLLAEDLNGDEKILITYGMIGVEIIASNGDKLQLAAGKSATITLPIDASQQASAPITIPLWYFDTTKNLWKEEGSATKQGNKYVGQVAHFSWWNCDYPGTLITLSGFVKFSDGTPAPFTEIRAYGTSGNEFSDADGYFSFVVPSVATINFTAYSTLFGTSPIVTYNGSTTNTTLADLILPLNTNYGNLKTDFLDCSGNPTTGRLWLQNNASGNVYLANGTPNDSLSVYTEIGPTTYKAYSLFGNVITGNINIAPFPAVTTIPTIQFCIPGWNYNFDYYALEILPDTTGCIPALHIEDTLSYDTVSPGTNDVSLFMVDSASNSLDTSLVVIGIFDMLLGFQSIDTAGANYFSFDINYNNTTININSDYGYLTINSTGTTPGSYIELEYYGFGAVANTGNPFCYAEFTFKTRFKRK